MPKTERDRHAETIIRNHAVWSIASGAIPLALADLAAVTAVQIDMIRQLCEVYGVDFQATKGKAMVTSITSAALARAGAASVVKMVPIAGTLLGSVTGGVLAGASTFGLGQAFKTHLAAGGTFLDLDVDRLKRVYRDQFEKGKAKVQEWQREATGGDGAADSAGGATGGRFRFDQLIRRKRASRDEAQAAAADVAHDAAILDETFPPDETSAETPPAPSTVAQKLEELTALRDRGLITPEDFEATKRRLLGNL